MDLSIVIPVWNEQNKIQTDLQNISRYFSTKQSQIEVIVVDDGSSDDTCRKVEEIASGHPFLLRLIRLPEHRGKGAAVRTGVLESTGRRVMFMDCGGNVPLSFLQSGLDILEDGRCQLAHGSRYLPDSRIIRPMTFNRRLLSRFFRRLARWYLRLPEYLTDTQCGFKLYDGPTARELYYVSVLDGFLFDLEIILLASQKGCRIHEFPIHWSCDRDSRLSAQRALKPVIHDLIWLRKKFTD